MLKIKISTDYRLTFTFNFQFAAETRIQAKSHPCLHRTYTFNAIKQSLIVHKNLRLIMMAHMYDITNSHHPTSSVVTLYYINANRVALLECLLFMTFCTSYIYSGLIMHAKVSLTP